MNDNKQETQKQPYKGLWIEVVDLNDEQDFFQSSCTNVVETSIHACDGLGE